MTNPTRTANIDFMSAPRITLAALHLETAQTMNELSECDLAIVGPRVQKLGYSFGVPGIDRPVSLKCWLDRGSRSERIYAVKL